MDFYWVYDLPNWLFGLLTIAAFVAFSIIGLRISRRLVVRFFSQHSNNDVVSAYLAAVGVFYGITLGLISVGTYTNYSDADNTVSQEAASAGALFRDVSAYPEPTRSALRNQLKEYIRIVVDDVWPKQREGIVINYDIQQLNRINTTLLEFNPNTERDKIIHAETLDQFNNLLILNDMRLQSVQSGLPAIMYHVIIIGALLNIMVSWLFICENFRLHSVLNILMAALLGLLVYLIAAMDNPFRGAYSIQPDALEFVRDHIMND